MSKEPKTHDDRRDDTRPDLIERTKAEPKTDAPPEEHPASPEELVAALDFPSINEPRTSRAPSQPHTLASLDPTEAAIGDPDLTLTVTGTNFADGAQIVFNGGAEETVFVSDTELTTIVKPSTATVAGTFPVTVAQQGMTVEPPLDFTFTEDEPVSRGKKRK